MTKVMHLIDSGGFYGAERVLVELITSSTTYQHEVISCGELAESEKPLESVLRERQIPFTAWRMKAGFNLTGIKKILEHCIENEFRIIHSHGYKFNVLCGLVKSRYPSLIFISTVHGYLKPNVLSKEWIYQTLDRLFLKRLDFVCLVSPHMIRLPAFKKMPQNRLGVVINGISKNPSYQNSGQSIDTSNSLNNFLAIGRLSKEKGFNVLIDAIQLLKNENLDFHLYLMGLGPEETSLKYMCSEKQLNEHVTFLGYVENPHRFFGSFQALVMSSFTEGIPITVLEAMRGGIPVISTDVGGISTLVGEQCEYLVRPNCVESLNGALKRFINLSEDERRAYSIYLQKRFNQNFTSEKMASEYELIYTKLCEKNS